MDRNHLRAAFRPGGSAVEGVRRRADMVLAARFVGLPAAGFLAVAVANGISRLGGVPLDVPAALGAGAGLAAAMALKVSHDHRRALAARLHGRPEYQELLAGLRTAARGSVASRRGDAWVVFEPGREAHVMGQAAYAAFRAQAPLLDEVVAEGGSVTVTRLARGAAAEDVEGPPTVERFDLSTGLSTDRIWHVDGIAVTQDVARHIRDIRAEDAGGTQPAVHLPSR